MKPTPQILPQRPDEWELLPRGFRVSEIIALGPLSEFPMVLPSHLYAILPIAFDTDV